MRKRTVLKIITGAAILTVAGSIIIIINVISKNSTARTLTDETTFCLQETKETDINETSAMETTSQEETTEADTEAETKDNSDGAEYEFRFKMKLDSEEAEEFVFYVDEYCVQYYNEEGFKWSIYDLNGEYVDTVWAESYYYESNVCFTDMEVRDYNNDGKDDYLIKVKSYDEPDNIIESQLVFLYDEGEWKYSEILYPQENIRICEEEFSYVNKDENEEIVVEYPRIYSNGTELTLVNTVVENMAEEFYLKCLNTDAGYQYYFLFYDVTYIDEQYVSIAFYEEGCGKVAVHPFRDGYGITVDIKTGEVKKLSDFMNSKSEIRDKINSECTLRIDSSDGFTMDELMNAFDRYSEEEMMSSTDNFYLRDDEVYVIVWGIDYFYGDYYAAGVKRSR